MKKSGGKKKLKKKKTKETRKENLEKGLSGKRVYDSKPAEYGVTFLQEIAPEDMPDLELKKKFADLEVKFFCVAEEAKFWRDEYKKKNGRRDRILVFSLFILSWAVIFWLVCLVRLFF